MADVLFMVINGKIWGIKAPIISFWLKLSIGVYKLTYKQKKL